jgi:hypothetical protein
MVCIGVLAGVQFLIEGIMNENLFSSFGVIFLPWQIIRTVHRGHGIRQIELEGTYYLVLPLSLDSMDDELLVDHV